MFVLIADKNPRVLFILPRMSGGGAERVVSMIANHLCQKDYDIGITVLVSEDSFYKLDSKIIFQSANFTVNRTNKAVRLLSLATNFINSILYIKRSIKEFRPDVVFSLLAETDIVTYLALFNQKHIYRICSERNDPTRRNQLIETILKTIYKKADAFVCQSQAVAQYYSSVPADKKVIIPNPIDLSLIPMAVKESAPMRIVSVGRLVKQKNFPLLIRSISEIIAQMPDVHLTIYGEGSERPYLEELIEHLGLQEHVELPGSTGEVHAKMRDASLFVMSSDYEGFPNALIEAIAMGLPVVSTDFATGVAREIVDENVGIVVPCADQLAITDAILTLLNNDELRLHIRKNGHSKVEKFDVHRVVEIWDDYLKHLCINKS